MDMRNHQFVIKNTFIQFEAETDRSKRTRSEPPRPPGRALSGDIVPTPSDKYSALFGSQLHPKTETDQITSDDETRIHSDSDNSLSDVCSVSTLSDDTDGETFISPHMPQWRDDPVKDGQQSVVQEQCYPDRDTLSSHPYDHRAWQKHTGRDPHLHTAPCHPVDNDKFANTDACVNHPYLEASAPQPAGSTMSMNMMAALQRDDFNDNSTNLTPQALGYGWVQTSVAAHPIPYSWACPMGFTSDLESYHTPNSTSGQWGTKSEVGNYNMQGEYDAHCGQNLELGIRRAAVATPQESYEKAPFPAKVQGWGSKLEGGDADRTAALSELRGSFRRCAFHTDACRVAQRALEVASREEASELVCELHTFVVRLTKSHNGNYVIQKVIETMPTAVSAFIVSELRGHGSEMSQHKFGCRILCRLLEHVSSSSNTEFMRLIDEEVLADVNDLCRHPFGHHVIEAILEHGSKHQKDRIVVAMCEDLRRNAIHERATHVFKAVFRHCSLEDGKALEELLLSDSKYLQVWANDEYGHYVVLGLTNYPDQASEMLQQWLIRMRKRPQG